MTTQTSIIQSTTQCCTTATSQAHKPALLFSNKKIHYRVSVYNYFFRRFRSLGYEFSVMTNCLQKENRIPLEFQLRQEPFDFFTYRRAIEELQPDAIILFLHLKDRIAWLLAHWLRWKGIPFAFWTKGGNWDKSTSRLRYFAFNYVHSLSNALILYAKDCRHYVSPRMHRHTFVANNTINFKDFPEVEESKDEIKRMFKIPFAKTVLFVGRMGAGQGRKKVDHLVDIFRELKRKDLGLILVGSGLSGEIKARLNPENTMYLGEIHDEKDLGIARLFKMADLCAIPGHVGLGLNQAFFWGLPVVAEEGDHPPEVGYLHSGRNGFLVPENDLAALREKVLYLLDNDAIRAQFSRQAREDILQEASIETMFSGFRDCAEYLTGSNSKRTR